MGLQRTVSSGGSYPAGCRFVCRAGSRGVRTGFAVHCERGLSTLLRRPSEERWEQGLEPAATAAIPVLYPDGAAVGVHDLATDREAQAHALPMQAAAVAAHLIELLEDAFLVLVGHARSQVLD